MSTTYDMTDNVTELSATEFNSRFSAIDDRIITNETKLAGIETGATADQTGTEILASINNEVGTVISASKISSDITRDTEVADSIAHVAETDNPHSTTKDQVLSGDLIDNDDVAIDAGIAPSKLSHSSADQYSITEVTGLTTALAGKSATTHTHEHNVLTERDDDDHINYLWTKAGIRPGGSEYDGMFRDLDMHNNDILNVGKINGIDSISFTDGYSITIDSFYVNTDGVTLTGDSISIPIARLGPLPSLTKERTGIVRDGTVTTTYDATARTITIDGTYEAYLNEIELTDLTDGWTSTAHPVPSAGSQTLYILAHDGTSATWSTSLDFTKVIIAVVAFNEDADLFGAYSELHGIWPHSIHEYAHKTFGTIVYSGGISSGYTLDSTTASDRRPSISEAILADEDNKVTVPALVVGTGVYTHGYFDGATQKPETSVSQNEIVPLSGNQPQYNLNTSGTWSLEVVPNSQHMVVFSVLQPMCLGTESQQHAHIMVPSQAYGSFEEMQAYSWADMDLTTIDTLSPELVPREKFILQYIGGNWSIRQRDILTGTRIQQSSITAGSGSGLGESDGITLTGDGSTTTPYSLNSDDPTGNDHYVPTWDDTAGEYEHKYMTEDWFGTQAEYSVLATKDPDTTYFVEGNGIAVATIDVDGTTLKFTDEGSSILALNSDDPTGNEHYVPCWDNTTSTYIHRYMTTEWFGTAAEYSVLATKDPHTTYHIEGASDTFIEAIASSTDEAMAVWDGTTGEAVKSGAAPGTSGNLAVSDGSAWTSASRNPTSAPLDNAASAAIGSGPLFAYEDHVHERQIDTTITAFWTGTQAAYDAIATPSATTLYFIEE